MTTFADRPLEEQSAQWREYLRRRQAVHSTDVEELEGHLRDQLVALTDAGTTGSPGTGGLSSPPSGSAGRSWTAPCAESG